MGSGGARRQEKLKARALGSSLSILGLRGLLSYHLMGTLGAKGPVPDPCSEHQQDVSWKGTLGINMEQAELHGWAEKRRSGRG